MKVDINGIEEEISENVKEQMDLFFNTLEGLRVDLCGKLGLDYLSATDQDIFIAIDKLKSIERNADVEKRAILLQVFKFVNRMKLELAFKGDVFPMLNDLSEYLVSVEVMPEHDNLQIENKNGQ